MLIKHWITTALLCLPALLLGSCGNEPAGTGAKKAQEVVVLKAYRSPIQDRIEALGTAQARESITITARAAGILDDVLFKDGQQVKKGDVIVKIDQDEAQAQLAAAVAQLAEHQREITRLQGLVARKAASTRDLDMRKTQAAITASNIKEIKARIHELTLTAPFAGKLGIRRISPGALVQPGQVITTLDAVDQLKVDFSIPSTMLGHIRVGTPLELRADALPDHIFTGTVTATDSRIDPNTRSLLLRASIDNSKGDLLPGMLMHVTLSTSPREALMVPEESVTQKEDKHYLTLVNGKGNAEIRQVQIGVRQQGLVEILQGLHEGEKLVVRGMGFAKAGKPVHVSETWGRIKDSQFQTPEEQHK